MAFVSIGLVALIGCFATCLWLHGCAKRGPEVTDE